jgi:hypothetical protein
MNAAGLWRTGQRPQSPLSTPAPPVCTRAVKHPDSWGVVLSSKLFHFRVLTFSLLSINLPISNKEDEMKTQHHQVITKILISEAIALGSWVAGATPASADPNPIGTDPNPFGALSCDCQEIAPPASSALAEIERGIRAGLSASPANRSGI